MSEGDIRFTRHALTRLLERGILADDVLTVVLSGEVIDTARTDTAFPSATRLGWVVVNGKRTPLHVVSAVDLGGETVVITAYYPNPDLWDAEFRRRVK